MSFFNVTPILLGSLAIALIIGLGALIKALTRPRSANDAPFPDFVLAPKPYFFTRAEHAFYSTLTPIAEELDLCIFPKVGLNDIFVDKPGANAGQYARYAQMHLDYFVVRRQTSRPVAGIELSGSSHERDRQRMRDTKKDAVFRAAGLPLLRFSNGVREADIKQQLQATLEGQKLTT